MPPLPSISSALSGLQTKALPTSPLQNAPLPSMTIPKAPNVFGNLLSGGVNPLPVPNMSTVNGPRAGSTPAIPQMSMAPKAPVAAPVKPAVAPASTHVTTPSGAIVDSSTGALIKAAPQGWSGASEQPVATNPTPQPLAAGNAGGTPAVPAAGSSNPLITSPEDEAAYRAYTASLVPTQDEVDATTRLNNLNASAAMAYTNAEGQPIAMPFITGQQAQIQRQQGVLALPLENQLSLLQAKRQMSMTASKAALDRTQSQLAAKRDLAKPVSTAYGGALSRYNPDTGKYEAVINPFGSVGGDSNAQDVIGKAISEGRLSADQVTRYGMPFLAAALEKDPGYNFITQKAGVTSDTASLKKQQDYADTTSRSFNTANANLQQLVNYMNTSGVNSGSVPIINTLTNKVKGGLLDPGTVAAFNAALAGLRAEYAQVLSRGGEVTEGQRSQAKELIPDNLSPAQLQEVTNRLKVEGANAIKEANDKVTEIKGRLGSNQGSSKSGSSSSSSIYDF